VVVTLKKGSVIRLYLIYRLRSLIAVKASRKIL
jgi:hypothetical protein